MPVNSSQPAFRSPRSSSGGGAPAVFQRRGLRDGVSRLLRSRKQIPVLLFVITLLPVGLLGYAVYQTQLASQAVRDINWAGSLRYRSLWLYGATTGGANPQNWRPMRDQMDAIRKGLRTRYPDEVAQTDAEWGRFTDELEKTGNVGWDEAARMKDAGDGLAYVLQTQQENHNRYVFLLFAMGILSLTVSLPWGISLFRQLQKAEQEAVRQSVQMTEASERFAALFHNMPVACFAFDAGGRVQDWNRACESLYGLPAQRAIGQPVWGVTVQPAQRAEAEAKMRGVCEKGQAFENVEWDYLRPDGHGRVILFSAFPLSSQRTGEAGGGIGAAVDITATKENMAQLTRRTEELKQSNNELQEFAFVASHDLKEPLRKIQTFGGILQRKAENELSTENAEYLERILKSARRMQALIDDILALARVTMKGNPFETVPMTELVTSIVADMEVNIEASGGRVAVENLPPVVGDPSQMRQLFQNLLANALKFHKPDIAPMVHIRGGFEISPVGEPVVHLMVSDNGVGFGPEYAEKIFEMFEQVDETRRKEGTGIGLAICRKIIQRHGGTLRAESVLGEGATFHIYLPQRPPPVTML